MRESIIAFTLAFATAVYSQEMELRPEVEVRDLGFSASPLAINNRGDIVGYTLDTRPFLWTEKGGLQFFLGELAGWARDITDTGQIVGIYYPEGCCGSYLGFLWDPNSGFRDLGGFIPFAINNKGEVAGQCSDGNACLWNDGVLTLIGRLGGTAATGSGLNSKGHVVGDSDGPVSEASPKAFVWTPDDGLVNLAAADRQAQAWEINDSGEIVGSECCEPSRAVVWRSLDQRLIPSSAPTSGAAINSRGWVVGHDHARDQGFLWIPDLPELIYLTPLGGQQSVVTDINDAGTAVGVALDNHGIAHLVTWTARAETPQLLHIETPNDPSRWGINTRQRLAWTYEGDAPQFQIEISRDGGTLWDFVRVVQNKPGWSQNFDWTVTGPFTSNARLRVTAIGDEQATDVNDANIRISEAAIEILRPSRKTIAALGLSQTIFFKHNLGARKSIAIDVSDDGGTWRTIAETRTKGSTTSSHRWAVDLIPTSRAQVRVRALDGSGASQTSEAFVVVRLPNFEITGGGVGGQMEVDPFNGSWEILGSNIRASGRWIPFALCDVNQGSCNEGDTIDFSTGAGGTHEDGVLNELVLNGRAVAAGGVDFSLRVTPVVVRPGSVTAPFKMAGTIVEFASDGQTVIARATVSGRGLMSVMLEPSASGGGTELLTTNIFFKFETGATTVNEKLP